MGSDLLRKNTINRFITALFHKLFWRATIVKSEGMRLRLKNSYVIPNGVDLALFSPMQKTEAIQNTDLDPGNLNIIFVATSIAESVKNFKLAQEAVSLLDDQKVKLVPLSMLTQEMLRFYYNAADLLLLTSLSEGSPNVIKEAMACNCPIVTTDVGDVREVIGDARQCHVTGFNPRDIAKKIKIVIQSGERSNGREKVSYLDSARIANKLIDLYRLVCGAK